MADRSSDPTVQAHLQQVYPAVDDIDIWVGGLAEDQVNGGLVVERRPLATIIRENTSINEEIQDNVFRVPRHHWHREPSAKSRQADTAFLSR